MATLTEAGGAVRLDGGLYSYKTTGALDIQWQLNEEAFQTMKGGSYAGIDDDKMEVPPCRIKIINAGASTLEILRVRK
jgi:hypothetical protein